jgi:hypothetical protein
MGNWSKYTREEREEVAKVTGKLRCVIVDVEEAVSKSGNNMIVISVRPSGSPAKVKYWLVDNDYFNRNATQFFDAFPEIPDGDFTFEKWIGCEGAGMFVLDDNDYLTLRYFISAEKAKDLPPFEGTKPPKQTVTSLDEMDDDSELPFDL